MIVRVILLLLGLASGVLLAAAAFYGVFGSSAPKPQAVAALIPPPPPRTMVVVAAKPIPTGTLMSYEDLRFAAAEPDKTTGGDFMRQNSADAKDQAVADHRVLAEIAGAVSRTRFDQGDPLHRDDLVKPGDAGFLAAVLHPGMRAVTLAVNVITGDAGLLFPGDHVDVVLTQVFAGHEADPGNRTVAEIVARDLRVIAVDQRLQAGAAPQKEGHPAQTVTLEVTPLQAQQLDLGARMGEMALAIRGVHSGTQPGGQADTETAAELPALWAHDLSTAAAKIKPEKKSAPIEKPPLRVIHGDKVESVVLP
ncbi:MAG TPA: Flp pilus assembly protein CpaB [Stellaceae bacterium]|jgi:pilus assembly protein CpaB|nr:Flp pilus assembly protein CpaB [Stellaceae bacterium]